MNAAIVEAQLRQAADGLWALHVHEVVLSPTHFDALSTVALDGDYSVQLEHDGDRYQRVTTLRVCVNGVAFVCRRIERALEAV